MPPDAHALKILPACQEDLVVVAEDPSFIVINKPTRLLSVPGRNPANFDSVVSRLAAKYGALHLAHRLDFDTSGLLVVPLSKRSLSNISQQFQARTVDKQYVALVDGLVEKDSGVIDLAIAAADGPKYKICTTTGKLSTTRFEVVVRDLERGVTRVRLYPETGRTHQLRLHMQALGHPILGCEFYGGEAQYKAERLCLHAQELSFNHPDTAQRLRFFAAANF